VSQQRVLLATHKDFLFWLSSCVRRQLWPKLVHPPGVCGSNLVFSDLRVVLFLLPQGFDLAAVFLDCEWIIAGESRYHS
jgi:hypothetical protein